MEYIGYIALISVGIFLGLTGGGGSILSVPILVYLFSMDVILASAYSFFIVGATSLVGTWMKQQDRLLDLQAGLWFGVPSMTATFCTRKWLIPELPEILFKTVEIEVTKKEFFLILFAMLVIISGFMILIKPRSYKANKEARHPVGLGIAGLMVGSFAGMTGIGGGFLILPALLIFKDIPFKAAAGTALLIVSVNSLFGFLGDVFNYHIDWFFLLFITGLAIGGIIIGNMSNKLIPSHSLQRSFGWVTLVVGSLILISEILKA